MKLHYTHHPIFNALRRLSIISGRVIDEKVVQHLRLLRPKEVYEVYNEIHVFADKLERFLGFANTRYPAVYRAWIPMYGLTYLSLCYCFVAFFVELNFYPVFAS